MFRPKSNLPRHALLICVFATCMFGCQSQRSSIPNLGCDPNDLVPNTSGPVYLQEGNEPCIEECGPVDTSLSPLSISDYDSITYQEMKLDDCINLALQNSKAFRDLGGTIISSPQSIESIYNPAIVSTDPRFSEEAALSAFDANFSTAAFFQNNDQASNLTFQGNNGIFQQDFHDYQASIRKLSATGTLFTLSNLTNYDNSNQTGQTLPHSWQTIFQGEFRHPLLQGSGTLFNRIAGPSTQPGVFGGVLIARTNTEISLSQFREGVRDLVSEVENAYWDLYFAYRNLEATIQGRDKAYEILVETTEGKSREGSQAQAQVKEQYLRFERDVLDAMEGRPTFGTRNNNGMAGGVFLSNGGIRVTERRLRLICGLPINAPDLIRTTDEPAATGVQFDWDKSIYEAFDGRQELVQQRWLIKQRELQALAAKNFLKPRFDLIGQYRFRGIGRSLTGGSNSFQDDINNGTTNSTAFGDLTSGDFQEWQVGAEFSMPLGFRAAHLGVRNAELALSRERTILQEQKREVVFGLSNAFGELRRTFAALKATEEQYLAAREFQYVMRLEVERGRDRDIELEAQRRSVDAEIEFRRAQIEYMLALKNIHFEKGTYLQFCNVRLTESASHLKAELDANERTSRRGKQMSYVTDKPTIAQPKPVPEFFAPPETFVTNSEIDANGVLGSKARDIHNSQPSTYYSTPPAAEPAPELDPIKTLDVPETLESPILPPDSPTLESLETTQSLRPGNRPMAVNGSVISKTTNPLSTNNLNPIRSVPDHRIESAPLQPQLTSPNQPAAVETSTTLNFSDSFTSPKTSHSSGPLLTPAAADSLPLDKQVQPISSSTRRSLENKNRRVSFEKAQPLSPIETAPTVPRREATKSSRRSR